MPFIRTLIGVDIIYDIMFEKFHLFPEQRLSVDRALHPNKLPERMRFAFVRNGQRFEDFSRPNGSGSSVLVSETHRVVHGSRLITLLLETIHTDLFSFRD